MSFNLGYFALTVVFTLFLGLPKSLINSNKNAYKRITEFVEKQNFNKDISILSCYCAYYQLRSVTKNSYYAVYPLEYMSINIDFILKTEIVEHNSVQFNEHIESIINSGKVIEYVDSMNCYPHLKLYKVINK